MGKYTTLAEALGVDMRPTYIIQAERLEQHEADLIRLGLTPDPFGDGWFNFPAIWVNENEEAATNGTLSCRPHIFVDGECGRNGCSERQDQGGMHAIEYADCEGTRYGYNN